MINTKSFCPTGSPADTSSEAKSLFSQMRVCICAESRIDGNADSQVLFAGFYAFSCAFALFCPARSLLPDLFTSRMHTSAMDNMHTTPKSIG